MDAFDLDHDLRVASPDQIRAGATRLRGPDDLKTCEGWGYIELATPCAHPWWTSMIWAVLGNARRVLDDVIDELRWLVIDPGRLAYRRGDDLREREYTEALETHPDLDARTGPAALAALLAGFDLAHRREWLEHTVADVPKIRPALDRVRAAFQADLDPRHLVLDVLPVPSREIRARWTEGDRDPTTLYRRVSNKNQRLARLIELDAPEIIRATERRALVFEVGEILTVGVAKLFGRIEDVPDLAYVRLEAKVQLPREEGEEAQIVEGETRALHLAAATDIVRTALDRDLPADDVLRALCAVR